MGDDDPGLCRRRLPRLSAPLSERRARGLTQSEIGTTGTAFGRSFVWGVWPISHTVLFHRPKLRSGHRDGESHEAKSSRKAKRHFCKHAEQAASCSVCRGGSIASDDSQHCVGQTSAAATAKQVRIRNLVDARPHCGLTLHSDVRRNPLCSGM